MPTNHRSKPGPEPFTVTHSDWGEDPYGWQVRLNGEVIDTYMAKDMADAYAKYMNTKRAQEAQA